LTFSTYLPARLDDAGDVTAERQVAEANAAEIELPQEGPSTTALLAAVVMTHPPLRRLFVTGEIDGLSHF
jgi:hypothetical protein